jgi:putative endonuclease
MTARSQLGATGERLAAEYLESHGYQVRERNVRLPPWGEIDIVAARDGELVFVEVRVRRGDRYGTPLASVNPTKQRRMRRAAARYLTRLGDDAPPARIDVIAVELDNRGRLLSVEHVENAVEG